MDQAQPRIFVNTTPLTLQPDRASRRNARSYVMRGKNSGKRRRRLIKKPRAGSWINRQSYADLCQGPERALYELACADPIRRQIASEWTMFRFAAEIGSDMRQKVYQFFPMLEQASYPNQVLAGNVFDRQAPLWFEHMGQSQTYVHNQAFVTMAYFDMIVDRDNPVKRISPVSISHMTKALRLLQTDLATIDRATAEVTISTIIAFTMVAFVSGDIGTAEKHLRGLYKVLLMRGGLASLRTCTYLQIKSCRLDLSLAMCTSSKPLFFTADNILWDLYLPKSLPASQNTAIHSLVRDSDPDLRMLNIWHDLHEFSRAANIAVQIGRKLEPDLLQESMISVQYRLLNLEYDNNDAHELLRVVMLAYSFTILPLLFSQFGAPASLSYPSLDRLLQRYLGGLEQFSKKQLKALLWLLVIVGISDLDTTLVDLQLPQVMQALDLGTWDEVLEVLKSFLWIDILHTKDASRILSLPIVPRYVCNLTIKS